LKSNLGLNRHFVALIPLYAVLTANGVTTIAPYIQKYIFRHLNKYNTLGFLSSTRLLLIILFITSAFYLSMWLYIWQYGFREGYPERKEASEFLRNINSNATIFCNDAILEVFSNIDYRRFNHIWQETTPHIDKIINDEAIKEGEVYVVTSEDKLKNLNGIGKIIFSSNYNKKTNFKVLILKVISDKNKSDF
jgi:hypothetical protein